MWVSNAVQQKFFNRLLARPENGKCADCGRASIDFGVLVCLNCSGAHRALGPSVTRVKSTKLDTWMSDWFDYMTVGNEVSNAYWQGNIGLNRKPNASSTLDQIKKFVQEKYLKRKFVLPNQKDPLTLMREKHAQNVQPRKQVSAKGSPRKDKSDDVDKASRESNPDDNLLDFENEPVSKPSGESITSAKEQKKLEVDLMDFSAEPTGLKKSHSLEPVHHPLNQLYQQPSPNLHIQTPYLAHQPHSQHYYHPNQPVVHSNFHFGQVHHHPQQQSSVPYGQMGFQHNLQHNPNVGYMMHGAGFHQPQQPISMNMNINMYANSISLNIHQDQPSKEAPKKKEDAFSGFNEFGF